LEKKLDGKVIAVDFDGVIAEYDTWKGVGVFGKPVQSIQWAMSKLREMGAEIVVHTCRRETQAVVDYLFKNGIEYDYINFSPKNDKLKLSDKKISADIYIDDKGLPFRGEWHQTFIDIMNFRRWGDELGSNAISSKS